MELHADLKQLLNEHFSNGAIPDSLMPLISNINMAFRRNDANHLDAEEKLARANRLYAFLSSVNQSIVHIKDETILFNDICHIAVNTGKFKVAWIANIDREQQKIRTVSHCGIAPDDESLFLEFSFDDNGPYMHVVTTGTPFIANEIKQLPELSGWRSFGLTRGWASFGCFPIIRGGMVAATLNICATENYFFNQDDVRLLQSTANELSFALNAMEQERKRQETENILRQNKLRLKQALSIAKLGTWHVDFSTGIATWAEETLSLYGMEPHEYQQSFESWLSFIHPEDKPEVLQKIEEARKTFSNNAVVYRMIRRDGQIRYMYSMAQYMFNDAGVPIGLEGVEYDITDIRLAEKALVRSQANLRQIVDLIPQSISAMDEDGIFVFANKKFASLFGMAVDDIIGKNIKDLAANDPAFASKCMMDAKAVISSGHTIVVPELSFTDHNGNHIFFQATKTPIKMAGSSTRAMLNISLDITEQKQNEEERSQIITDMVQRNKDLEQFSYMVSHNLRSPVANIIALINLMQADMPDDRDMIMEALPASVEKLDEIIRDLNHILQVKHDVDEQLTKVRLTDIVNDVRISISSLLNSEHVAIETDFAAIDELLSIKSYLYSIFFNLISNSIKYKQANTHPVIRITSAAIADKLEISFTDNGLGIDLDRNKDKIFGLYKRFHSHTEGKGMGLYMVKTQVEKLGGKISVDSQVNRGTTFTIVLNRY